MARRGKDDQRAVQQMSKVLKGLIERLVSACERSTGGLRTYLRGGSLHTGFPPQLEHLPARPRLLTLAHRRHHRNVWGCDEGYLDDIRRAQRSACRSAVNLTFDVYFPKLTFVYVSRPFFLAGRPSNVYWALRFNLFPRFGGLRYGSSESEA